LGRPMNPFWNVPRRAVLLRGELRVSIRPLNTGGTFCSTIAFHPGGQRAGNPNHEGMTPVNSESIRLSSAFVSSAPGSSVSVSAHRVEGVCVRRRQRISEYVRHEKIMFMSFRETRSAATHRFRNQSGMRPRVRTRSPPIPFIIGSATPSTAFAAMPASIADPPCSSTRPPACEACT